MTSESLQAVILVAGKGERLRPLTAATPKSLLSVAGRPILSHTLQLLISAGIKSVTFITGFHSKKIQSFVRTNFPKLRSKFVRNAAYATTNTLASLMLARGAVAGRSFILIDGDLIFDGDVLYAILSNKSASFLACDSSVKLDDEAVRAIGRKDRSITAIGKKIAAQGIVFGESIGLAKIASSASRHLFRIGPAIVRNGGRRFYYEAAFQRLIDERYPFRAVDVRENRWVEIDTPADLHRAQALFH